ncbi:hypothetical protein QBC35DRAFT_544763 [Podospora australis]|uniref:NADH-ubiquinone oxidoreductase 17.8 kDa subunit n=1 Tax=Podospora australis TaxID=1536484 RepID=A0AAN6X076_9PEZI|nr:hypothetical protein QBC35DRAFT_544763 [Podospora australis]
MSAFRQRAAQLARQSRPQRAVRSTRSYGSSHGHDHHHEHTVEEKLGPAFYVTVGTIAASYFVYSISRTGKNGEESSLHKYFKKLADYKDEWETRNHLVTAAMEQAAHDKHLLYNAPRSRTIELKYPEVFQHGSPFNVPAGHYVNMDKVIAHYHQKHLKEEERKASKLAAASQQ